MGNLPHAKSVIRRNRHSEYSAEVDLVVKVRGTGRDMICQHVCQAKVRLAFASPPHGQSQP